MSSYCSACQLVPEKPAVNMAVDLEVSSVIPTMVSTRRLEGTLVAPDVRQQVPNHLTETRLFGKPRTNRKLQVLPTTVLFDGYKVGTLHQRTMRIVNTSTMNQPMHIIPPKTSFFSIQYSKKQSTLIPGLSMNVEIEFKPTEWQYYYDCIRIHCQDEQNILIPIHAYPVMNLASFPRFVTFDPTPIGQSQTESVTLKCDIPVEFEYRLTYLQSHPAFTVSKMKGVVPAKGKVIIDVVYSPTEFSTAVMELKLEISQYNSTFKTCTFTGTSTPGLATEKLNLPRDVPKPPSDRVQIARSNANKIYGQMSRHQKLTGSTSRATNSTIPNRQPQEVFHEGYVFPANLDTPSAVSKVLLQEAGKMKASQVKKEMSNVTSLSSKESSVGGAMIGARQLKQAAFLQEVQMLAKEERANHLRWVTRLGEVPMTYEEIELIYQRRDEATIAYQRHSHVMVPEDELARTCTVLKRRRTLRKVGESPECPPPTFDLYMNNMWARRHRTMQRFVQAGRKVIVRLRCQERLEKLQRVLSDLQSGKSLRQSLADIYEKKTMTPSLVSLLPLSSHHVCPFSFPKYAGPNPSCAGQVEFGIGDKPVEIKPVSLSAVKNDVPFIDLKVPQQSDLLGYCPVLYPYHGSYIPPGMPRQLLSGAEDEIVNLSHIQGVDPAFLTPHALTEPPIKSPSLMPGEAQGPPTDHTPSSPAVSSTSTTIMTTSSSFPKQVNMVESSTAAMDTKRIPVLSKTKTKSCSTVVEDIESEGSVMATELDADRTLAALVMPSGLLEPPDSHPMQLLNPSGGVTSYLPLLPYSEATLDHALLPLPPYPTAKHPHVRPDPSEVIPVLMNWKMFPSAWLISTEADRKLASIWKPCLSNSFTSDLLPSEQDCPALLSDIQPDDYVDTESLETLPVPTMKMLQSHFLIPVDGEQPQQLPLLHRRSVDSSVRAESSTRESPSSKEEQLAIMPQASELFQEAKSRLDNHRSYQFNQLGRRVNTKLQNFLKQLDGTVDDSTPML